jgi:hypothetical protein
MTFFSDSNPSIQDSMSLFPSLSKISEPAKGSAPDPSALTRVRSGQGPTHAIARGEPAVRGRAPSIAENQVTVFSPATSRRRWKSIDRVFVITRGVTRTLHRKEVIQPQVPLRLPCYDFTPVTSHSLGACLLAVGTATSGATRSHGVTGGVYKARERIHPCLLIRDY